MSHYLEYPIALLFFSFISLKFAIKLNDFSIFNDYYSQFNFNSFKQLILFTADYWKCFTYSLLLLLSVIFFGLLLLTNDFSFQVVTNPNLLKQTKN